MMNETYLGLFIRDFEFIATCLQIPKALKKYYRFALTPLDNKQIM